MSLKYLFYLPSPFTLKIINKGAYNVDPTFETMHETLSETTLTESSYTAFALVIELLS